MRLQIVMEDREYAEIREAAAGEGLTVSEWARQAMRQVRRERSRGDVGRKLAVLRAATAHAFPTADIADMLDEIERGYVSG